MNAACIIESMGASVALVDGKLKLAGLDRLDRDTAIHVLAVACARKAEIMHELRGKAEASPKPPSLMTNAQFALLPDDAPLGLRQIQELLLQNGLHLSRTPSGQLFTWGEPPLRLEAQEFVALMVREAQADLAKVMNQIPVMPSNFAKALLARVEDEHAGEGFHVLPEWRGLGIPVAWPAVVGLDLQSCFLAGSYCS